MVVMVSFHAKTTDSTIVSAMETMVTLLKTPWVPWRHHGIRGRNADRICTLQKILRNGFSLIFPMAMMPVLCPFMMLL